MAAGACTTLGAAVVLATASAAASASAVGSHSTAARSAPFALTVSVIKSTGTAGYISEKRGIKTVSVTFEVPKITSCTASEKAGMGPVVILVGKGYFVGAGAEASCQDGTTSYTIAINHNGTETHPLTIGAGEKISVDIGIGSKAVSVKIDDLSTKQKVSQFVPKGKITAAELGDDSLSQGKAELPIPKFTDHQFSDAKINGKALSHATPLLAEELVKSKTVLVKPGPLNKAGDGFVMLFEHAS